MSEPDSTPRRRPPTIDLTATEVGAEKPASTQAPGKGPAGPRPDRARSHVATGLLSAAAGAVVIAAAAAGLWFSGAMPSHAPATVSGGSDANGNAMAGITAQLKEIQGSLQTQQQPDAALAARVAAVEASAKSLSDSLTALTARVDQTAAAVQSAAAQAKSAADAADAAKSAAQGGLSQNDLDALTARVAALESAVKSVSDNNAPQTPSADDKAARFMVAAEALLAATERGAPFQAELAAVKTLGADQSATAALDPFAATGVPTATTLARELANLAPTLVKASAPESSDTSFLDRLRANAQNLVRVTPVDAPAGSDPASVARRVEVDAANADIAAAQSDIAKLPAGAQSLAAAWVQKAKARDAAIAAARSIATTALAALGKPQ